MSIGFPCIHGKCDPVSDEHLVFNNMEALTEEVTAVQPDFYDETHVEGIETQVRTDINRYIIPSLVSGSPVVPNLLAEAKLLRAMWCNYKLVTMAP